jgi:hypothetical protein
MEKIVIASEIKCLKCGCFMREDSHETEAFYSDPGIQGKTVKKKKYDICIECQPVLKQEIKESGKVKVIPFGKSGRIVVHNPNPWKKLYKDKKEQWLD